jgi:FkbM family methyltransferase
MKNIDLSHLVGKDVSVAFKEAQELFEKNLEGKIHAHKIYSHLIDQVPNEYSEKKLHVLRGMIREKIWKCEKFFFWNEKFFSQAGQDKIIKNHFFQNNKNGFFIEIGAYDGIIGSNCCHFEKFLNWEGIAIEASKIQYDKLKNNRKCKTVNKAISNKIKDVEFVEVIEGLTQMSGINNENNTAIEIINNNKNSKTKISKITTTTFEEEIKSNLEIDYLSIDIEGEELDLLKSIDFNKYTIKVISVENNVPDKFNYNTFFKSKNFSFFDRIGQDEIFFNNRYYKFN